MVNKTSTRQVKLGLQIFFVLAEKHKFNLRGLAKSYEVELPQFLQPLSTL